MSYPEIQDCHQGQTMSSQGMRPGILNVRANKLKMLSSPTDMKIAKQKQLFDYIFCPVWIFEVDAGWQTNKKWCWLFTCFLMGSKFDFIEFIECLMFLGACQDPAVPYVQQPLTKHGVQAHPWHTKQGKDCLGRYFHAKTAASRNIFLWVKLHWMLLFDDNLKSQSVETLRNCVRKLGHRFSSTAVDASLQILWIFGAFFLEGSLTQVSCSSRILQMWVVAMYWYPEKPFRRCPTANSHNPLRALLKTAEHFEDIRYRQLKCLITVTTLVDSFLDRGFAFVVFVRLGNENLNSNGSFHNQKGNNLQQWSFGFQHSRSCLLFKMPPAGDPCQMSGSPNAGPMWFHLQE